MGGVISVLRIFSKRMASRLFLSLSNLSLHNGGARGLKTIKCPPLSMEWKFKIHWNKPDYVYRYDLRKTGDVPLEPVDISRPIPEVVPAADRLAQSDPVTQKVLSLAYSAYSDRNRVHSKDLVDSVKRHRMDDDSVEARVARHTSSIRCLHVELETVLDRINVVGWAAGYDTTRRKGLRNMIRIHAARRHELLKDLRFMDYKRYEWLLGKLDVTFKNDVVFRHNIERRETIRRLFSEHRQRIHRSRRKELHEKMKEEHVSFLKEKVTKLRFVQKEEKELRLTSTIADSDITDAEEQLEAYLPKELPKESEWPGPGQWPYDNVWVRSDFVLKKKSRPYARFRVVETYDPR